MRVLAATHRDLEAMCDDGSFRRDLFYRLDVFTIRLPPLSKYSASHQLRNWLKSFWKKLRKLFIAQANYCTTGNQMYITSSSLVNCNVNCIP